jgi:hypothetical protein
VNSQEAIRNRRLRQISSLSSHGNASRKTRITQKCFEQKWVNYPKMLKAEMGKMDEKG